MLAGTKIKVFDMVACDPGPYISRFKSPELIW